MLKSISQDLLAALFKMFEISKALSAFTLLIVCFILFSEMHKLNNIVKNINEFVMLLTSMICLRKREKELSLQYFNFLFK